jgi:hypothetical protein
MNIIVLLILRNVIDNYKSCWKVLCKISHNAMSRRLMTDIRAPYIIFMNEKRSSETFFWQNIIF